ncbi:hypothetical protein [Mesorhizobium sp. NZP2298]|uniref:hypothetical protein n=1 Tax=Mesorhizobium sp. NZP2298 TaxID=2483403 RepID=UPI00155189E0|nr:hypothetical protein [Mesorhizobium sp. NZP2298]QKC99145.1 hypothetical protein EB231_34705 [Mesorhizobium sp. NZP2298]
MGWKKIDSAPKDGSIIRVKRIYEGSVVYDGPAAWRTVRFDSLTDPLTGQQYAEAEHATGWMRVDSEHRVPEPTHWFA